MTQQFGPQDYVPPTPPPKKKHRAAKIILGVFAGLILLIVLVSVLPSNKQGTEQQATDPTTSAPTAAAPRTTPAAPRTTAPKPTKAAPSKPVAQVACADQGSRNDPCVITVGKPFQLGKHKVLAGWKVSSEFGLMNITGRAKNIGESPSSMFVEVKFLSGDEVLADVTCTTDELEPGQTQAISCFSSNDYTHKYTRVTAEATF